MERKYVNVENGDPGVVTLVSLEASPGFQVLKLAVYFTREIEKLFFCLLSCSTKFNPLYT